ncbi:MAG: OsmC family protein [Bryobacteraceae bacterium]|nr:OsmC family protein [Bryobacterales bacterium]MEB2360300.1 OsmC family protein [Bryobacterales bacterium]NUM99557.1 OsmC family protein [Bryobacteraceae bacterium]
MSNEHEYRITTTWTGNLGTGTSGYRAYRRDHEIHAARKSASIPGSSDPVFRGDPSRYNPEELLVAALSACHMLSYLHLCAEAGIAVTEYRDEAAGYMAVEKDGGGRFTRVVLRPQVAITDTGRAPEAISLHDKAHGLCFIARSVNFTVEHEASITEPRAC